MRTINIHEAKTHLSRLVDEAEKGDPFIIAKAGKPKVKVIRLDDRFPSLSVDWVSSKDRSKFQKTLTR